MGRTASSDSVQESHKGILRLITILGSAIGAITKVWVPGSVLGRVSICENMNVHHTRCILCGPGRAVGIASALRAGRSGDQIPVEVRFPALGSTQTPVKWVPGLSRG